MERALKAARASGSLNLSNRALREVPDEVYRSLDAIGEGEKWWEAVELQKLILAHNDIESLREDLKNLSLLSVLNVSNNKLVHLPAAIGELPMLKSLDLSQNSIVDIPEVIGSATSLVKLDCSNNKLKDLPNSLGRCSNLLELKASNNCITSLPEDLAHCLKLIKLDVEGNKLTMLSENMIASWVLLTELNASRNLLTGLPENIGRLSRLIRLDFHQNRISSIPASIKGCCSLAEFYMGSYSHSLLQKTFRYLGVSGVSRFSFILNLFIFDIHRVVVASSFRNNVLSSLTAEIGALSLLGTLDLHSNQLKEYPVEACKLRLQVLDLSNNSLSGLPPEIGMMTTLRKLVLTGNPLRTLRSSLVSGPTPALLKFLRSRLSTDEDSEAATTAKENVVTMAARLSITSKELSLEGMGLSAVPAQVWESSEIVKVDLSRNSIQELPPELTSCVSLQALILSRNKIQEWPGVILKSLLNLSCLKLDNNPLRQIPADGFQAVSKLQILDLSDRRMQLCEVPSDILSLQQLQILDLSQNSLQLIPEGFKNLTSLTELNLSDNSISTLPPELGLLEPSLQALRLDGNPLRSIRRTILDRGTKAVLKYLKDKIPEH